jgi:hypothetical protein
VYLRIVQGTGAGSLSLPVRVLAKLMRRMPFAVRRAEMHFARTIETAEQIGAVFLLGQACFDMGILHQLRGQNDRARKTLARAIQLLEECEAESLLVQAKEALAAGDKAAASSR